MFEFGLCILLLGGRGPSEVLVADDAVSVSLPSVDSKDAAIVAFDCSSRLRGTDEVEVREFLASALISAGGDDSSSSLEDDEREFWFCCSSSDDVKTSSSSSSFLFFTGIFGFFRVCRWDMI